MHILLQTIKYDQIYGSEIINIIIYPIDFRYVLLVIDSYNIYLLRHHDDSSVTFDRYLCAQTKQMVAFAVVTKI